MSRGRVLSASCPFMGPCEDVGGYNYLMFQCYAILPAPQVSRWCPNRENLRRRVASEAPSSRHSLGVKPSRVRFRAGAAQAPR